MSCKHGDERATGTKTVRGAAEKAAHRHEQRCARARIVVHEGLFGDSLYCAGCGKRAW